MPNVVAPDRVVLMRQEYHADEKPWRQSKNLRGRWIGIEVEAEHEDGYHRILQKIALPAVGECELPIFEQDGTLDEYDGVEIVFPPVKASALKDDHYVLRAIQSLKGAGAHFHDSCGMHINVNTNGWKPHKKATFMLAICGMPPSIMKKLGGRDVKYHGSAQAVYDDIGDMWCRAEDFIDWSEYPENDHDHCAEWREDGKSCEIRFPKATTDMERINRLLFWVDVLQDFADTKTKQYNPQDLKSVFIEFKKWLTEQGEEHAKLATYLSRA